MFLGIRSIKDDEPFSLCYSLRNTCLQSSEAVSSQHSLTEHQFAGKENVLLQLAMKCSRCLTCFYSPAFSNLPVLFKRRSCIYWCFKV